MDKKENIEDDPFAVSDMGYYYMGYYHACQSHRLTMAKLKDCGWSWKFILAVRKWVKEEL